MDDEAAAVDLAVEPPVRHPQQPQAIEPDRAATVPGDAGHPLPQLWPDRLSAAVEGGRGEGEEGEAERRLAQP
ncbi:MAG TPA: hypothetical protein VFS54_08605 [Solirubrobacterales bacterium]|nr:hypothetical protein [Solirubrobacterales bacterium]